MRGRTLALWMAISLVVGTAAGWLGHRRWAGPSPEPLEATRASFVAQ